MEDFGLHVLRVVKLTDDVEDGVQRGVKIDVRTKCFLQQIQTVTFDADSKEMWNVVIWKGLREDKIDNLTNSRRNVLILDICFSRFFILINTCV